MYVGIGISCPFTSVFSVYVSNKAVTMNTEPRAITADELRERILDHMRAMAKYWATVDVPDGPKTTQDRIEGAMFSVLEMLDGVPESFPAMDLVAKPRPDDKQFHIENGENWIEDGTRVCDMLHEHWHKDQSG